MTQHSYVKIQRYFQFVKTTICSHITGDFWHRNKTNTFRSSKHSSNIKIVNFLSMIPAKAKRRKLRRSPIANHSVMTVI